MSLRSDLSARRQIADNCTLALNSCAQCCYLNLNAFCQKLKQLKVEMSHNAEWSLLVTSQMGSLQVLGEDI